jgi:hypothetical protein
MECTCSVWTELMVRVRVRVAACVAVAFSVWSEFTVPTGKRSEHRRGMPLVTRLLELQPEEQRRETQWHSSSVNFCRKTRTVQQPQPDGANPNTAEPMVKNAHRTAAATQ